MWRQESDLWDVTDAEYGVAWSGRKLEAMRNLVGTREFGEVRRGTGVTTRCYDNAQRERNVTCNGGGR